MRHTLNILILAFLCVCLAPAQTSMTNTTLAAAVTSTSANVVALSSATNVSANGFLYVDKEVMQVAGSYVSGTQIPVIRGQSGTLSTTHVTAAVVYVVAPNNQARLGFRNYTPAGSCTSTNEPILPVWNVISGQRANCLSSGQWFVDQVGGTMGAQSGSPVRGFCTGTAGSAETEYLVGAACSGATTSTTRHVVNTYGTLANLRVYSSANVTGGTSKDVLTVQKNGSDTTITCTIAAAAATCSDLTHSVAVVPGDVITFKFVSATSDTAANVAAVVGTY